MGSRSLSLIEEYKNSDYGEQFETDMYSVFEEAVNKPDIRVWLDWNDDTYKPESKLNTERFFSWISNETITIDIQEEDGEPIEKELEKIIGKSSDIRDLATFINDPQALKKMEESRSVSQAYSSSSKVGKEVLNETLQSIEYELKVAMAHSYHFNDSTLLRLTSIDKLFKSLVGATGATSLLASEDVSKNVLVTCTNSFFTEIEISNYKVHKNLKLDKLNRLNVFAGINNSGKSSLLEAIYLLCRQNDIYSLFDVLKKRHKMNELDSRWVANNFSINSSIKGIYDGKECEVQVSNEPEISSAFDKTGYLSTITLNGKLAHKILSSSTRLYNGRTNETKYDMVNILCNSVISTPYSVSTSNEILKYHEAAVSTKAIDRILSFMRDQVEKDLIDIQLVSDFNRFLVNHKNIERAIDLSQFGEGFQRIFMICLEFASAQDGVILIDELESAIHFKLLRSFVDFINKLSLEFNVQVFITSHSKECINTIVSIQSEDVSAYSLSIQSNGESKCKYISGDDLAFLISQMDADLREAK